MTDQISSTLKAKIILEEYRENGVKIYNFGLGENPVEQPNYYIEMMRKYAHKKQYAQYDGIPELNQTLQCVYNTDTIKYDLLVGNGLKELLFIVEGEKMVDELLSSNYKIQKICLVFKVKKS